MNPKRFLTVISVALIGLGLLGVLGILGGISPLGFFHPPYWINWVHLSVGAFVGIIACFGGTTLQARVTLIPAVLGTLLGASGLLLGSYVAGRFNIPELSDPSDHIAHLVVGIFAWWAWSKRR